MHDFQQGDIVAIKHGILPTGKISSKPDLAKVLEIEENQVLVSFNIFGDKAVIPKNCCTFVSGKREVLVQNGAVLN